MPRKMIHYGEGDNLSGYLAIPDGGAGPAALVLHAWWGLNDFFKSFCDRLAAKGYVAFAPDLFGGKVAATVDEAARLADTSDSAAVQNVVIEAVRFLQQQPGVRPIGIGVIGFSFGAAYATLLSTLRPDAVRAVVLFYGAWAPDLSASKAAFLGHFAEVDEWEPREGVEALRAALEAAGLPVAFHVYEGTGHWFFESNRPDAYHPEAAERAWQRTLAFLAEQLNEKDEALPQNSEALLARVEQGWTELQGAFAGRTPEELTKAGPDGWSVREHLAHVVFWERFMLLSQIGGQPATEVAGMDAATLAAGDDPSNAIVAERSRSRTWENVLAESREVHAAVVAELSSRLFETLLRRSSGDSDERPLLLLIVGNTYEHYVEHAGYIRKLLES